MAFVCAPQVLQEYARELPVRIRTFVWAFTGMFSAASLAIAFLGYIWSGTFEQASSNFLASVVSGSTFWLMCRQKLGPIEA